MGFLAPREIWRKRILDLVSVSAYRLTESFVARSAYSLTWIEQAGITTPFTTPLFPFIQTLGQQTLDNINPAFTLSQGPTVVPQPPGPDAGLDRAFLASKETMAADTRNSGTSACKRHFWKTGRLKPAILDRSSRVSACLTST